MDSQTRTTRFSTLLAPTPTLRLSHLSLISLLFSSYANCTRILTFTYIFPNYFSGNFAWGSEHITAKTRILGVVFNASNNELVRTNTLVKSAVIQVDATPFRIAYEKHYGKPVTTKRRAAGQGAAEEVADAKKSKHLEKKLEARQKNAALDPLVEQQFGSGRLYAAISSRPGQSGRADGYILEGAELEHYVRRLRQRGAAKHG